MKLLAIDTSTELATVAIAVAGTIYSATHNSVRQHAQFLLPMLERLLISAQISVSAQRHSAGSADSASPTILND